MGLRVLTTQNLFEIVHKKFAFEGVWREALGEPEIFGLWFIYGPEKHGKTTFMLLMANMLSEHARVLIVSAEQGVDADFVATVKRCQISPANKMIGYLGYITLADLKARLKRKRNAEKVVFIDNTTVYGRELRGEALERLMREFSDVVFVILAHQDEEGNPLGAVAKNAKRLAKRIFQIDGLTAISGGRVDGKRFIINDEKAALYHGQNVLQIIK